MGGGEGKSTPDKATPLAPTFVSYPSGSEVIKSWIPASLQAFVIFLSISSLSLFMQFLQVIFSASGSGIPRRTFSRMVPENRDASWATREILER